ncbi:MAG: hypothetical protein ABIZ57_04395 [Candidatus Limnocylindria bacterium]
MTQEQWPMLVWAGAVALAIVAGAWTALSRPQVRATLNIQHVAGAALLGLFGWESLVNLPGVVTGYWTLTAGLGDVRGVEGDQTYVVAQVAFVVAAAFSVTGILRRRAWGAVLGIGLAASIVVWISLILFETTLLYAESMDGGTYFSLVSTLVGMQAIPALVIIALLAWPMIRRTTPPVGAADRDWPTAAAPGSEYPSS